MGRLAKLCARVAAERVTAHGAPVELASFDRYEVRVKGEPGVDVYGVGQEHGMTGDWDDAANEVSVTGSAAEMAALLARPGLTQLSAKLVKACPR